MEAGDNNDVSRQPESLTECAVRMYFVSLNLEESSDLCWIQILRHWICTNCGQDKANQRGTV
jgi:hypothetical protein